ncbi:flagellar biosynthesis repressor FlbT [Azospirillum doebereinerae]|uniref:flagellar biosynthesis repressor FlbT n=1 Tax=Azospirillum doebereinerae TaxID=92933 RepID=UPI003850B59B
MNPAGGGFQSRRPFLFWVVPGRHPPVARHRNAPGPYLMPLKFVLRPNEKVIINGAVIGAGDRPGSFFLYNTANFLRGREVLKEEQIDCIEKKALFRHSARLHLPGRYGAESSEILLDSRRDACGATRRRQGLG